MSAQPADSVSPAATTAGPRPWLLLVGVLVVITACYIPVLGAPFLWDYMHLIDLPLVQHLAPMRDYFDGSFWQHDEAGVVHSYYRPLAILTLALDHRVYGDNPSGFHLTNLIVHLAATGVLFALLRREGASGTLAAFCSALWGLHPRLTEAAAWVSGRTDALAGFFVLSALLLQQSSDSKRMRYFIALLLLLGLFCKETALAGLLAVWVGEWQRPARASDLIAKRAYALRVQQFVPTILMFAGYAVLRLRAVGLPTNLMHVSPLRRSLAVLEAIGRYAYMFMMPWFPDAQIGNLRRRHLVFTLLGAFLFCVLLFALWRFRTRVALVPNRALVLTAGALGLALYAIPFSFSAVAADRFLYLPWAGVVLAAAPVIARRAAVFPAMGLAALAILASFGAATFARASAWADEVEFWSSTLRHHPEEPSMASIALASAYAREGLFDKSLAVLRRAARPAMDLREYALRNTGTTLLHSGRYGAARATFSQLLAAHPRAPAYAFNLALAEISLDHFAAASAALQTGLNVDPTDVSVRTLSARLQLLESGRQALDAWPRSAPLLARARLEESLGLRAEATQSFGLLLEDPKISREQAEEACWFVLRKGDAARRSAFFRRYTELTAGHTEPQLQLAYDTHRASLAKLERVWPTLGLEP